MKYRLHLLISRPDQRSPWRSSEGIALKLSAVRTVRTCAAGMDNDHEIAPNLFYIPLRPKTPVSEPLCKPRL